MSVLYTAFLLTMINPLLATDWGNSSPPAATNAEIGFDDYIYEVYFENLYDKSMFNNDYGNNKEYTTTEVNTSNVANTYNEVNTSTSNVEIDYEMETLSESKKKKKKLNQNTNTIRFDRQPAHTPQVTDELRKLLMKKESALNSNNMVKWNDFKQFPLPDHQERWNNLCCKLWPGVAIDRLPGTFRPKCLAALYNSDYLAAKTGIFHSFHPKQPEHLFVADFLACGCKYVTNTGTVQGTVRYFFAMKLSNTEYLLLTYQNNYNIKSSLLEIVDFVSLSEV